MEKRERLLQRCGAHKGVQPQRLDNFNVLAPNVQGSVDFYAALGFRLTEYAEEDRPSGHIAAAWMHRKGNVHDLAFTNGRGPRVRHLAYRVPTPLQISNAGPERHGISNAFFLGAINCKSGTA